MSAIGVARGNTVLVNEINAALAALRANGTYQTIASKYFPPSLKIYGD